MHEDSGRMLFHRDLKPQNVLLTVIKDNTVVAKISDFDLAKTMTQATSTINHGTWHWLAPEYFKISLPSSKGDVYAVGIIMYSTRYDIDEISLVATKVLFSMFTYQSRLYQMCTWALPYFMSLRYFIRENVFVKGMRPATPDSMPVIYRCLLEKLWAKQPDERPDIYEVKTILEQLLTFDKFIKDMDIFLAGRKTWIAMLELGPFGPERKLDKQTVDSAMIQYQNPKDKKKLFEPVIRILKKKSSQGSSWLKQHSIIFSAGFFYIFIMMISVVITMIAIWNHDLCMSNNEYKNMCGVNGNCTQ